MFRRLNARILIALLGLVVSNVAVARKSQPVSPEILEATTMRFWVDSTEFVVPYELLKDAAEDKTLNSDDFVQKYYEPLRAALPKYVSRTSCAGTCTAGIWADLSIPCATLKHGSRKFSPSGSPIEITRAVELYLNHIVAQMEYR